MHTTGTFQAKRRLERRKNRTTFLVGGGCGACVAIERLPGNLGGREGSFVLMHGGARTAGSPQPLDAVVSGLATGDLTGLEGRMAIEIKSAEHLYDPQQEIGK